MKTIKKKSFDDPQMIEMFNQMVGTSDPDPDIVVPKYDELMKLCRDYLDILEKFRANTVMFKASYARGYEQLEAFITHSRAYLQELQLEPQDKSHMTAEEIERLNSNRALMQQYIMQMKSKYDAKDLGIAYRKLKESDLVGAMIAVCKTIKDELENERARRGVETEDHDLSDTNNLSDGFIINARGSTLHLFKFSTICFKHMFISDKMIPELNAFVLRILQLLYNKGFRIYQIITSPDIDVEKFSSILVESIDKLRTQIPRCDGAFDTIKNSVGMLQNNFSGYYKDFVISNNPGIIIDSFISDVATNTKSSPGIAMQFKKITQYYRKAMKDKVNDPKAAKLLSAVGKNIAILEKNTADETDDGEASPASEADPVVAPRETITPGGWLDDVVTKKKKSRRRKR